MLLVWKLDRFGRTMRGLVDLAADLAERGVELRSLTDGIDTAGTTRKQVFHVMAAMAEMERDLNREHNSGTDCGPARGKGGRPENSDDAEAS